MPSVRIIDKRKPSPVRLMPRNVNMTWLDPSPHVCRKHRKLCKTYADATVWCEHCGRSLSDGEYLDRRRGKAVQQIAPGWKPVKAD